ncbi:MAG: NFACT RNA binding domain-containing protein [Candidatus Wallbacteria bacterium]|nr:NFACT RNA binding domain-containing protein [Candidatus Wallbacteria bacterium]
MSANQYFQIFLSPGGREVLVARSSASSEFLTFGEAAPHDYFIHVEHTPGAHTILRRESGSDEVSKEDLEFAARLAALHSKQKKASRVSVTYTEVKNVKRAPGPYKGTVLVSRTRKIVINISADERKKV